MKEYEVRNIVEAAVRRERRFWCSALCFLLAIVAIATLQQSPVYTKEAAFSKLDSQWKGSARRMLFQDSEMIYPLTESEDMPSAFSEITEQLAQLGDALALLENNSSTLTPTASGAIDQVSAPAPEPEIEVKATETLQCPPGPKGDSAPEFLSQVFSYDPVQKLLTITASTITVNGSLVVEGYTGIKQSLFVGGDPSVGAASTEVGPGTLLMYANAKTNWSPTIAGFATSTSGFQNANVTVLSELYEDPGAKGGPRRISTGLFK